MAAAVTGSKTVTKPAANHTAAYLTTLMATPVEQFTILQLHDLGEALRAQSGGDEPTETIGALLK
ncbi:MAG TPA: hypothetical protein VGG72_05460 [Bryobacteraceae bacterium]|jgi:hypothetical protein